MGKKGVESGENKGGKEREKFHKVSHVYPGTLFREFFEFEFVAKMGN